jgi:LmbE family N-acetylglucosaminyl deacetylase
MLGLTHEIGRSADAPLRVLVVGAHADDIEIGAGGTLFRLLAERPHTHVDWVVLSGTPERQEEAHVSAEAFLAGVDHAVHLEAFPDGRFALIGTALKDYFASRLQPLRPDLVLTHRRQDAHQDHRAVADLSWQTFRGATLAAYEIPKWEGDLVSPNGYVRLDDDLVQRKVDLLMALFPSQAGKPWFDPELFRGLMRLRGAEAGVRYAEAFTCEKLVW